MDDDHRVDDGEDIKVPIAAIQKVDPQVMNKLPAGIQVTGISPHSTSFWTRTARIDCQVDHTTCLRYFLKVTSGDQGREMVMGEFLAMSRMHQHNPALVPRPIAWGTYDDMPDAHFLLCEFRDMLTQLPGPERLPAMVADLHRGTTSPGGRRFGFDCSTFHGNVPIEHGWSDSWEGYFSRTTRVLIDMEQQVRGRNPEILAMAGPFFDIVVPRLLGPLESGGRSIRPALIHGDLWHGNVAIDKETKEPIIFDAAGFYAHNEYELAVWRQPWNEIGALHRAAYCEHMAPSEPVEDFEDRGILYATRVNLLDSILYREDANYRDMLISTMRQLVDKFAK